MCLIEAHEREQKYINDEASSGGGRPLLLNSTKYDLISHQLLQRAKHKHQLLER